MFYQRAERSESSGTTAYRSDSLDDKPQVCSYARYYQAVLEQLPTCRLSADAGASA